MELGWDGDVYCWSFFQAAFLWLPPCASIIVVFSLKMEYVKAIAWPGVALRNPEFE